MAFSKLGGYYDLYSLNMSIFTKSTIINNPPFYNREDTFHKEKILTRKIKYQELCNINGQITRPIS